MTRRISKTEHHADEPPLDFEDIFGVGSKLGWFLLVDPIFPDHDRVLGFSMPQRLLREGNENREQPESDTSNSPWEYR